MLGIKITFPMTVTFWGMSLFISCYSLSAANTCIMYVYIYPFFLLESVNMLEYIMNKDHSCGYSQDFDMGVLELGK